MSWGSLYGVGVGPGDPDLVTLKALEILRSVPVIAAPKASRHSPSMAWRIVKGHLGKIPGQTRMQLLFPMSYDPEELQAAWHIAFEKIGAHLAAGQDVAFITEGDANLFSTFIYLNQKAQKDWPEVKIQIIPAVSSVHAVASVANMPLADGQERIGIIPATYGVDDLRDVLSQFDTTVLMKIGSNMPKVYDLLEELGLLQNAVCVMRATMHNQQVFKDLLEVKDLRGDCFTMVLVTRRQRHGILAGRVPNMKLPALNAQGQGGSHV